MNSYYGMGIAAEWRMHQLLDEVEHHRLVRGIEPRHHHPTDRPSLRSRLTAAIQRLVGRAAQPAADLSAVEGC